MIPDAQRQRVAQYQAQRERYLRTRRQAQSRIPLEREPVLTGYPRYPLLIALPLAILGTTMLLDLLYLITGESLWTTIAFWLMPFALAGAVASTVPSAIDWWETSAASRAKTIGMCYLIGNVAVVALFTQGWFLRLGNAGEPETMALVLSSMGAGIALLTGWLGGEFVDRLLADLNGDIVPEYTPRSLRIYQLEDAIAEPEAEAQQRAHA